MAEPSIFNGIALFDKTTGIHDQVSAWGSVDRDSWDFQELKIFGVGTENHRQGWQVAGLAQFLAEAEGRIATHYLDQFDLGVEHVLEHVRAERRDGQCRKEVLAQYWHLSALYRVGALRETFGLIDHFPEHQGLRALAGELIVWVKIHRTMLRLFRGANGLIRHPGIRQKNHPELNELPHQLSDVWEREVTEPHMRGLLAELRKPSSGKLRNRPHSVIAERLYRSPEGQRIEELTRGEVRGRLSTEVGIKRWIGGGYVALMPRVEVIPESRGLPPQVVWEVDVSENGRLTGRLATNDLAHPTFGWKFQVEAKRGEIILHPNLALIPEGWLVLGPNTPMPEAPPWTGDVVMIPDPAEPPEEPEPEPGPDIPGAREDIKAAHRKLGSDPETKTARRLLHRALKELKG